MALRRAQLLGVAALIATAAVLFGAGALGAWYARARAACPVEVGQPFPEMAFSTVAGETLTTRMLAGRNAVLLFTTPTCPACKIETPGWREATGSHAGALTLWQIVVGESIPRTVTAKRDILPGDVLIDDRSGFAQTLNASRVPLSILLDARQVVRGCFVGVQPAATKRQALRRLLGREPGPQSAK